MFLNKASEGLELKNRFVFAEILFDLAAGDIACDQTLSKRLISCKQMHEGEDEGGYT